jgi:hypothetical protein
MAFKAKMSNREAAKRAAENGSIFVKAISNAKLVNLEKSAHLLVEDMEEVIHVVMELLL